MTKRMYISSYVCLCRLWATLFLCAIEWSTSVRRNKPHAIFSDLFLWIRFPQIYTKFVINDANFDHLQLLHCTFSNWLLLPIWVSSVLNNSLSDSEAHIKTKRNGQNCVLWVLAGSFSSSFTTFYFGFWIFFLFILLRFACTRTRIR